MRWTIYQYPPSSRQYKRLPTYYRYFRIFCEFKPWILIQLRTQALTVGLTTKGPISAKFGFKCLMFATIQKDAILSQYRQGVRHAWHDSCHKKASSASSGEVPYRHEFLCSILQYFCRLSSEIDQSLKDC